MQLFMNACEADEPLRLVIRGPVGGECESRILHQPFALVGRDSRADIPLEDALVSRRHAYLQVIAGDVFWVDLDSRSGTFSEGKLQTSGWLDHGQAIQLGPFGLERVPADEPVRERRAKARVSPLIARSAGDRPLPEVSLEFLNGPARAACWPVNRVMSLVGSTSGCKFRLDDPSVAPFHCCLIRTAQGLWVVDLLGHSGTRVNEKNVRCSPLAEGDVLQIGRYSIRILSRPTLRSLGGKGRAGGRFTSQISVAPGPALPLQASGGPLDLAAAVARGITPMRQAGGLSEPEPGMVNVESSPVFLEKGGLSESLLVSVVNQFGLMQQQMLDQFQQTISILVQTFGNLHREQMDTIREELDQIQQLTREFQDLKKELAARTEEDVPASRSDERTPISKALESTFPSADLLRARSAPDLASLAASSAESVPLSAAPGSPPGSDAAGMPSVSPPPSDHSSDSPRLSRRELPESGGGSATGGVRPESDREMVVWLHERMVRLQRERETRWRKILKMLPGLS